MVGGMGLVLGGGGESFWIGDMMMVNASVGLMNHASRFPCHACEWETGAEDDIAPLRTFEGIVANRAAWQESGGDPSRLKHFKNCRDVPLSIFPPRGLVCSFVPPSSLHLVLGITNMLYQHAKNLFHAIAEWAAKLSIGKKEWQGQHFEGQQCHKLLDNVDILREIVYNDRGPSMNCLH